MRAFKLSYLIFFVLSFLAVTACMIFIDSYAKNLINSNSFPQSNTIPRVLEIFELTAGTKENFLHAVMAVNIALAVMSYASFLIYLYFIPYRKLLRKRFGLIYDLSSNAPIPFAVIKLLEKKSGKVVVQAVADIYGRYNLIAENGSYRLTVEHGGYKTFTRDLPLNTYYKQITLNIALSPNKAWKLDILFKKILNGFNESISEVGFVLTAILTVFSFNPINLIIFTVFAVQLVLDWRTEESRNWGTVYDISDGKRLKGAFVSVLNRSDHRQVGSQITDENGRYGFILEEKSQYLIKVALPGYRVTFINQPLVIEYLSNGEYAIQIPSGKVNDLDIGMKLIYIDPSKKAFT